MNRYVTRSILNGFKLSNWKLEVLHIRAFHLSYHPSAITMISQRQDFIQPAPCLPCVLVRLANSLLPFHSTHLFLDNKISIAQS